ncbi:MAG: agmatine deiminase family protein [Verrucomicrobiota bacterium]
MAKQNDSAHATPAAQGYRMPAEWEPHDATWLGWPHEVTDWPGKIPAIRWVYAEMIRKLAPGERIRLCVNSRADEKLARYAIEAAGGAVEQVDFLPFPTNRGWMRDSGPIYVKHAKTGAKQIIHWHFNAWARYRNWRKDRTIPELAARRFDLSLVHARSGSHDVILEGGGIEVNGRGTLLTTEECYLDPKTQVRNPSLSKDEFERALQDYLGVRHILWLGHGVVGDDTHGHIDDLCRFVNATTVVAIREKNPKDINYRPLEENWERLAGMRLEDGAKLQALELPMPAPLFFEGARLPASYANFYIGNAAVIVPTFNDPNDRVALGILADLFPGRAVVGIHAVDLVLGYGTLHCLTQQEPR